MASVTAATAVQIAALTAAARIAAKDIEALGSGEYSGVNINAGQATRIDAELLALKTAVVAITG
jgi:hypothetical protein